MKLSENFSLHEFTKSQTAIRNNIDSIIRIFSGCFVSLLIDAFIAILIRAASHIVIEDISPTLLL